MISNPLLIHKDNTSLKDKDELIFDFDGSKSATNSDVDNYISTEFIPFLKDKEFDILYIKDSLTSNYIDFYGLILAYHIRLSPELKDKRFVPIVILSDLDAYLINKITPQAKILFTKNIFLIKNNQQSLEDFKQRFYATLKIEKNNDEFLDLIEIKPPEDYLSHHSIANEWSMLRWAKFLGIEPTEIREIKTKISSMLYYKYLKAKYQSPAGKYTLSIKDEGKILYIDDEWEKGWNTIFEEIFKSEKITYNCIEEKYKDKEKKVIINFIIKKVDEFNPDIILLDLRLHDSDFDKDTKPDELTGVRVLNKIKEINPGIQVIIFTASRDSLILDKIYELGVSGYIIKEHPDNYTFNTVASIKRFENLISTGFEKKYLKEVWEIRKKILCNLNKKPFQPYIDKCENFTDSKDIVNSLPLEIEFIFNILNSDTENKLNYSLSSIVRSLEIIQSIFVFELSRGDYQFRDDKKRAMGNTLKARIDSILQKKMYHTDISDINRLEECINRRNGYIHVKQDYKEVTPKELEEWFALINIIIEKIISPIPKPPQKPIPKVSKFKILSRKG